MPSPTPREVCEALVRECGRGPGARECGYCGLAACAYACPAAMARLALAEPEPDPAWVSVDDRLPEQGERVLAWAGWMGVAHIGRDWGNRPAWVDATGSCYGANGSDPTHWMPLPEPPA